MFSTSSLTIEVSKTHLTERLGIRLQNKPQALVYMNETDLHTMDTTFQKPGQ